MSDPEKQYRASYRGSRAVLQDGFFRDAIRTATLYRRAAGFFSASVFLAAFDEFQEFFCRGGVIELVCSPRVQHADIAALCDGIWAARHFRSPNLLQGRLASRKAAEDMLRWAVANRRMSIRIAIVIGDTAALYHEKFGIFFYGEQPLLAFEGSANESLSGFKHNFERVTTYRSGILDEEVHQRQLAAEFELLWANKTNGLDVIALHDAIKSNMIVVCDDPSESSTAEPMTEVRGSQAMSVEPEFLRIPDRFTLREYQMNAIEAWIKNRGTGILEMATGTGKTCTALVAATKVFEYSDDAFVLIVVAPYIHLVDQWADEGSKFGLSPIRCFGSRDRWQELADAAIYRVNHGSRRLCSIVVTNASFSAAPFQRLMDKINVRTLLIADEVHNLGAPRLANALPVRVSLRLGLSATPTRWMDPKGTDRLAEYFGPVVYRFGLQEALKHDPPVLVPYRYHPVIVELDEEEQEEYSELSAAIGRCVSNLETTELSEMAMALLIRRSRLIASARSKLEALKDSIRPYRNQPYTLVYCGDASVEFGDREDTTTESEGAMRQIDAVTSILGHELGMAVAQYTARTDQNERRTTLTRFASGELQAIVAIRCLDEGVNIPNISRAFILASSTNNKQFIQRRGRILRKAYGKSSAEIFDFVVRPPATMSSRSDPSFDTCRRLIKSEMRRVVEFANLAENRAEARAELLPLLKEWDLLYL